MPNRSEYQPLAQSAEDEHDDPDFHHDVDLPQPQPGTRPSRRTRRLRAPKPGAIDLSKLDAAFKRWTESIAQKVKRKKKAKPDDSRKEIMRSVFEPTVPAPYTQPGIVVKTLDHRPPMTQADYDNIVASVRRAISEGIHPKMITKGSSGSYFARAKEYGKTQTVAVFKPKDEEPYGRLNPKTTKWLHRQLRWLIPFGRACLIPNLSYISEAAASLLDDRMNLNIVPKTQLVSLSSPSFFYDWLDRNAAKKGKPLPEKIGSMQMFMHGYQDASDFLRKHPWPGRYIRDTFDDSTHRTGRFTKRFLSALKIVCGKTGDDDVDMFDPDEERALYDASEDDGSNQPFYWSGALQESFREELEKLVILDFIMHNTDRGADNYMIKHCEGEHEKPLVDVAPTRSTSLQMPQMNEVRRESLLSTATMSTITTPPSTSQRPTLPQRPSYLHPQPSTYPQQPNANQPYTRYPHIHIAAIDNSLAFPHEYPKGWRSYTYGWLYLPVSVIGQPFSQKTRDHFLPLLTSKAWWEETTYQLRKLFALDPDFNRKMFQRQLAVIKGQAYNVVESLRHYDEGPLELTRRQKVLVWDDEVEIDVDADADINIDIDASAVSPDEDGPRRDGGPRSGVDTRENASTAAGPLSASKSSPRASVKTLPALMSAPAHRRTFSASAGRGGGAGLEFGEHQPGVGMHISTGSVSGSGSGPASASGRRGFGFFPFPPPMRRAASDARPVPFVSKLPRVHPGTSGVTVLEHMERVDAVEAGLRRLEVGGNLSGSSGDSGGGGRYRDDDGTVVEEEEEEVDVGLITSPNQRPSTIFEAMEEDVATPTPASALRKEEAGDSAMTVDGDVPAMNLGRQSPVSDIGTIGGGGHREPESLASSLMEEDLVALSRSTSALDPPPRRPSSAVHAEFLEGSRFGGGGRAGAGSGAGYRDRVGANTNTLGQALDWIREESGEERKKVVICERIEFVKTKALFSCW